MHVNWDLPDMRQFDVVILNTSYLSTAAQWMMRVQLRNTPWVFWGERLRRLEVPWQRVLQRWLTAPFAQASGIVCIGSVAQNHYRRRFPSQRLFNIPYFCDLDAFRTKATAGSAPRERALDVNAEAKTVQFLFCGQMIPRKGVDLLLEAFESLVEDDLPVELRLVGREADLPDMLRDVSARTREHVVFEGFQDPMDLPEFFEAADVFVLPSRHDGWGVVVNQALGAGLPLVCSDAVGAAHDIIVPGRNGTLVPAGDVDALADALRHLAMSPETRRAWGRHALASVDDWTPTAGARRWVDVIRAVLSPASP